MKTLIVMLTLLLGISSGTFAQDAPTAAQDAFKAKYPNATDVDWEKKEKDGKTMYIAEYNIDKTEYHAVYDASGKLIKHKTVIMESELPAAVKSAIKSQYKDHKVDDAYRVEKDGQTFYMVTLDGKEDKKVAFSTDGKVMKDEVDED